MTNRKRIELLTNRLNERLSRPAEAWTRADGRLRANVGHLFSHNAPCYGGYRLTEMYNEGGGECGFNSGGTEPRRKPAEFVAYLEGIHDALDVLERQQRKAAA